VCPDAGKCPPPKDDKHARGTWSRDSSYSRGRERHASERGLDVRFEAVVPSTRETSEGNDPLEKLNPGREVYSSCVRFTSTWERKGVKQKASVYLSKNKKE